MPPKDNANAAACEHCDKIRPVMVPMQPGRDGAPWQLCSKCWLEGVRGINYIEEQTS